MNNHRSEETAAQQHYFEISDSVSVLLIICFIASFFTVLLWFYPGQAFLKDFFWPLIALPGLLALGTAIKLLIRKPIVRIDHSGIKFFRSGIFIPWSRVRVANVQTIDKGDGETEDYLIVKYLDTDSNQVLAIDFVITGGMNKTVQQVAEAIDQFMP